ncbi:MAG TPA: hypothetical protein DEF04_11380 [Clostridiales bacterium]|nr:hypothetical protein [Clostridiales bacterium]
MHIPINNSNNIIATKKNIGEAAMAIMDNKYQANENKIKEKHITHDIYRNDSELTNSNSYMIYELNNTFNDKSKDVLNRNENIKLNNKNIYSKSENKKNEDK